MGALQKVVHDRGRDSPLEEVTVRVGLLGFGTVGSSFAEVLAAQPGSGVRITRIFNRGVGRKRSQEKARFVPAEAVWTEHVEEVLEAADVDVVVELLGGLDPAERWLRKRAFNCSMERRWPEACR